MSVVKSKLNSTSYLNSLLSSNPSSSKRSTGSKIKQSVLTLKKLSQFTYQKVHKKISENTSNSNINHPASISDENDECSAQINITHPFFSIILSESFLNLDVGVHE